MHNAAFLEAADCIGSRLCRDALWDGGRCNWLGWAMDVVGASWSSVHRAQTPFLYDGTAGIAMFLGRLYGLTRDPIQKATALGALNHAVRAAANIPENFGPSVYSGAAGVWWATLDLGLSLGDAKMSEVGLTKLQAVCSSAPAQAAVDVIGGSAGTIQVLLDVAQRLSKPDLADIAQRHGDMLLRCGTRSDAGWSWDTLQGQSEKHLCGYGHGAGGIGCALLDLWSATGNDAYRDAALGAFRYERSHFSPEHHNWPDLRNMTGYAPPGQQVFAMAWCHGAPGIGLSRLRALELIEDEDTGQDLNEAVQATVAACSNISFPASGNLSLCHGIGGNCDLLLAASDRYGRGDLRQVAENAGHAAIAQIRTPNLPWPCGVTTGGETPNLMLGLSGIGHFFLRLYDSLNVPSVLLIRPEGENVRTFATAQVVVGSEARSS